MQSLIISLTALGLGLPLIAPQADATAQSQEGQEDQQNQKPKHEQADSPSKGAHPAPLLLPADEILGTKIRARGERTDNISDLLIEPRSGRVHGVLLDGGATTTFSDLLWQPEDKVFEMAEGRTTIEASSPRERGDDEEARGEGEAQEPHGGMAGQPVRLREIQGAEIRGRKADEAGTDDLGSVGSAIVDVGSGHLVFVTTSVGGVLGIGAESRVIPFEALEVQHDDDGDLLLGTDLTEERLEAAPSHGDGPDDVNNPVYRDSLYSYYGVDRPQWDQRSDADPVRLVTLDQVIGREIRPDAMDTEGRHDAVRDFIIDAESGKIIAALARSGDLVPVRSLRWVPEQKAFTFAEGQERDVSIPSGGNHVLAKALSDSKVRAGDESIGKVGDCYLDISRNEIAYLTVDVDGKRLLPWSVFDVRTSADGEDTMLSVSLTKEQIRKAPKLDGEAGATIYNPDFRSRADALGSERGDDEKRDSDEDGSESSGG